MQPYYQANDITIYNAMCQDVIPFLPPVDCVITDPPYAAETHNGARTNPIGGHDGASQWAIGGNEGQPLIDFPPITADDLRSIFASIAPLLRTWLVSFMDYKHIVRMEAEPPAGLRFVRFGVWDKPNAAPQFSGDRPSCGWEGIAILHKLGGRMRWNGGGSRAVYRHNISHQDHRISDNPAAKPIPLLAELIKLYSDPGALILDPFMGSGTTIAAARLLGRRAIGIEQDTAQCAALVRWLERPVTRRARRTVLSETPTLFDLEDAA